MILFLAARPVTTRPTHPRRPSPLAPSARLFARPGARAFTAAGLLARLPMGMLNVSALLMIARIHGSYALAGAVTATALAATAVVGPWTARLVDRHGQARVAVPATALAVAGSLALVLCVRGSAPTWTLFLCTAATATTPNTGGMARARWAQLLRDDPAARHTAHSFEQAADELCFLLGPLLATLLCTTLFPEAGTAVAATLLLTGTLLFTAQRRTEPPAAAPAPTAARPPRSPLRTPGLPPLLAVFAATGAVFGSLEVVTVAYADGHGARSAAGAMLALQAAGSCAAGLLCGLRPPAADPRQRLMAALTAMAALLTAVPLAATTGRLPPVAAALLVAGVATAPAMIAGMALLTARTPAQRLNEGMTLAVTALLTGIAAGSATGGRTVDLLPPGAAGPYAVPVAAAALALAVAPVALRRPAPAETPAETTQAPAS
ncbi:MFS transporter [Streptomyces catenulae]|uniref:MFS transporter n=1 Tax=Streptomyces catenulae TaxID=66875 RepID=UPI00068B408D